MKRLGDIRDGAWSRRQLLVGVAATVAAARPARARQRTRVRLGNTPFLGSAPIYVALERELFAAEGLEVELLEHAQGWQSFKAVQEGTLELAMTAALPLAYSIINPRRYSPSGADDFVILADTIVSLAPSGGAVGRRDLGVHKPGDLRGKRVAVPVGTTLDLYFDLLRSSYQLGDANVTVVDLPENRHLAALMAGEVAAIFSFRHTVAEAQHKLGERAALLTSAINFTTNWLLVGRRPFVAGHAEAMRGMLRALDRAAAFIAASPAAGREILIRRSGLSAEAVGRIWGEHQHRIQLPESLARNLETQMRWILRRSGRGGEPVPDLRRHLAPEPMLALWPERVSILR